ncbi:hypothetical protein MHH52_11150 [Paenibacillus sp. FSL K6-0276]|uniref:hypothetical protein n=1 Tax=Paenibacillus sp. FSL K6-0276 TaxID=2921450 RepID=UPI0030EF56FA
MTELNPAAKQICEDNYKSNCHRCPLRPVCVRKPGPGQEALDRWVSDVNEKAEQLVARGNKI